jgi:hypothetical protein
MLTSAGAGANTDGKVIDADGSVIDAKIKAA